jgi:hypothetical protein
MPPVDPFDPFAQTQAYLSHNFAVMGKGKVARKAYVEKKDEDMPPMAAKEGFTFGCDPEVFIKNKEGVFVPPTGIIPGTKEEPAYVGDDVFLQIDGMAAEFNIVPAANFEDFDKRVAAALDHIKKLLPKGWSYEAVPFVRFDKEVFDGADVKAKELGCHPDFNAWTGEVNPPPITESDPYLRTAAGHIHLGWTKDADLTDPQHILNCRDVVKQLDWYIGGWSTQMDPDPTRRRLYGRAGACRYKSYGVEYRVPSNFWVTTKANRLMMWNRMQSAVNAMAKYFMPDRGGGYSNLLIDSINSGMLHPELTYSKYPIMSLDERLMRF